MKQLPFRSILAAALAVFCALSLAACDGHESNSSGDDSSNGNASSPNFNVSGTWTVVMDGTTLGTITFDMSDSGSLSGSIQTDSGERASINGQMSGSEAEYTMKFGNKTYLVSIQFSSAYAGTGTLVDANGHVHSLELSR